MRERRGRQTSSGWDGRRSPLFSEVVVVSGPGRLRAALLGSHHAPGPAGREGDCSVVEPSLASLASLASLHSVTVYFVVVRAGRVVGRGGQRGGGGLDHHLSQGWRRVGPSGTENIQSGPARSSQVFVSHWTTLDSHEVIKTFIKRIHFKWENFMLDLFPERKGGESLAF